MTVVVAQEEEEDNKKNKTTRKRKMGLASVDAATLKRIAMLGGKARAKDIESLRAAGKRGGEVVKALFGMEYYQNLGVKGGGATLERYTVEFYSNIGKKGV